MRFNFRIGPFNFGFGKDKKQKEAKAKQTYTEEPRNGEKIKLTNEDVFGICDSVGAFDNIEISDADKEVILGYIAQQLNSKENFSHEELSQICTEGFKQKNIDISKNTANLFASSYIDGYNCGDFD